MHKITRAGEAKFTHFWLPRNNFEQIYEQDGWIFISHKGTYAAIKSLRDGMTNGMLYCWGNPQQKYNIGGNRKPAYIYDCDSALLHIRLRIYVRRVLSRTDRHRLYRSFGT